MRITVFLAAALMLGVHGAAIAQAQQDGASQPSRPVFSLPPGEPEPERPDPTVQGPRAPGYSPPRAIDPNAPRGEAEQARTEQSTSSAPATSEPTVDEPAQSAGRNQGAVGPGPTAVRSRSAEPPPPASTAQAAAPDSGSQLPSTITGAGDLFEIGPERSRNATPGTADSTALPASVSDAGLTPPLWLIALALLLAGGLGFFFWRRRGHPASETGPALEAGPLAAPTPDPRPDLKPAAGSPPETDPLPVAPAPAPHAEVPAQLELDFEPLDAVWGDSGLALKFRLYLKNISDKPVHDIGVHLGIRSADRDLGPSRGPAGLPNLYLEKLEAKDMSAHEGEMRLDDSTMVPILVEGKEMVLPVVDIMPRYRDSADNMRKIEVALLVGRERNPPAEKLRPLAMGAGLQPSERLGCRMIALPGVAAPAAA